jgi:hypothetical protein
MMIRDYRLADCMGRAECVVQVSRERLSASDRIDAIKDEDGKRVSSSSKHGDSEMLRVMELFGGVGRTA